MAIGWQVWASDIMKFRLSIFLIDLRGHPYINCNHDYYDVVDNPRHSRMPLKDLINWTNYIVEK